MTFKLTKYLENSSSFHRDVPFTVRDKLTHFWLLSENIGYTQWLLLFTVSVFASAMSKLQKEMYPSLRQP